LKNIHGCQTVRLRRLLRPDLPPGRRRLTGFPKIHFVGGHNDAGSVPVEDLVAAANTALKREGRTLSTLRP